MRTPRHVQICPLEPRYIGTQSANALLPYICLQAGSLHSTEIPFYWFASYLSERMIRTKCSVTSTGTTEYSDYEFVTYGTPQGSCLGPLIYLIFTNDMAKHLENCNSIRFADDTTFYQTHKSLRYLKWCLQEDLKSLIDWFSANKLTLNLDKTSCVLFKKFETKVK